MPVRFLASRMMWKVLAGSPKVPLAALRYFRAVSEGLFGLRLRGGKLFAVPSAAMPDYSVHWTDGGGTVHRIDSHSGALAVDGAPYDGGAIG